MHKYDRSLHSKEEHPNYGRVNGYPTFDYSLLLLKSEIDFRTTGNNAKPICWERASTVLTGNRQQASICPILVNESIK